jgi:thiamine-monophosphate kinase
VAGDDQGSGEDRLIARYFAPIASHPAALGLTDDAAALTPPAGFDLVLTADAVSAGVHFFADDPPDAVAHRALRVNLSDLAAKGARPLGFLLTIALPRMTDEAWLGAFAAALADDARTYQCPLLGGDTTAMAGPLTISITAIGTVPQGRMVRRSGAKVGDKIFVSGTIGDAALALPIRGGETTAAKLSAADLDFLNRRFTHPEPRLALADALLNGASAAMDISDGLAGDLAKLCRVSGVSAVIAVDKVPHSAAVRTLIEAAPPLRETALSGGDDYEILATVPPDKAAAFASEADRAGVAVTVIGEITAGAAPPSFVLAGEPITLTHVAYSHF